MKTKIKNKTGKRVVLVSRRIKRESYASANAANHAAIAAKRAEPQPATDGLVVARLDRALLAMIRDARIVVERHYQIEDVPSWDDPCIWHDDNATKGFAYPPRYAAYAHAVGFIAGCAALCNVTPLELLESIQ